MTSLPPKTQHISLKHHVNSTRARARPMFCDLRRSLLSANFDVVCPAATASNPSYRVRKLAYEKEMRFAPK